MRENNLLICEIVLDSVYLYMYICIQSSYLLQSERQTKMLTSIKQITNPNNFTAKSLQNLATPRQHVLIEKAARAAGVNAQTISRREFDGANYETLTRANAAKLIEILAAMPTMAAPKAVTFYSIEIVEMVEPAAALEPVAFELAAVETAAPVVTGEFVEITEKAALLGNGLVYDAAIEAVGAREYKVISAHNNSVNLVEFYQASGKRLGRCSCKHHEIKRAVCKHLLFAYPVHIASRRAIHNLFSATAKF